MGLNGSGARDGCSMTSLSVIIPTWNEAEAISGTLDAVRQLGENIEIIVVDGGSTDQTRAIAESYGFTDGALRRSSLVPRRSPGEIRFTNNATPRDFSTSHHE